MLPRFFVPSLPAQGSLVDLPSGEAHHLADVRRLHAGDLVCVFDGRGHEHLAEVAEVTRRRVSVRLRESRAPCPPSPLCLIVAQAVLKGDKMNAVVRDLTMLGVTAIQPLVTDRAEVTLTALVRARRQERWQRVALASAKQCGRSDLPRVGTPLRLQDWLATDSPGVRVLLAEPELHVPADLPTVASQGASPPEGPVTLLVGPEGGWSRHERALLTSAGFVPWTLGRRTLRADAAALVAATILQFLWGDLRS